jgi:hypothetical protein
MGYACPVCEVPQRDGEHLANHLAFTAMLRGDDHEDWLAENAPGWNEDDPATLADRVTEHAEEADYEEVFEDTTADHAHGHGHAHGEHGQHAHGAHDQHTGGNAHGQHAGDAHGAAGGQTPGRPNVSGRGYDGGSVDEATLDSVMAEAQQLTAEMYGLNEDDPEEPEEPEEQADIENDNSDDNE